MKMFNEMSIKGIRRSLEKVGVEMTDEQFHSLTYSELRKVYKKSKKAYELYKQVDEIICKKKAPLQQYRYPQRKKLRKGLDKPLSLWYNTYRK